MSTTAQPRVGELAGVLNNVRKDLLDLGLRNPLLNYRLLKSRGLEVIDERPSDVYRLLVGEGKQFSFLPATEQLETQAQFPASADRGLSDDVSASQTPPEGLETRFTDKYLQTSLTSKQLQTRLLATYYTAHTSIEEQGVNTLFLALGMLRWQDADTAEETHCAPLILIPVELERSNARERFRLKYSGEELGGNVSLGEFLKQSFGIRFPELPEGEDLNVAVYLANVENAIASETRWSVDRDAIVLGFFSFSKFLMYRDLDPSTWPDEKALLGQDLLNNLLGTGTLVGDASPYGDSDFVDNHLADRKVSHVVDADSSQTVALLDVSDGYTMVIQGPPGTGKSQTIVNVIAEALAAGRTVLFVSEKMAALKVVKRRLDAVGLGPACLELHSNKGNKKEVIEELRRTAQIGSFQLPRAEPELIELEETRRKLNEYCEAVNLPVGKSAETPCSLYGRLLLIQTRLAQIPTPQLDLPGVTEWSDVDLRRKRAAVKTLQGRVGRCGLPVQHPFWGSQLRMFLPTQREAVQQLLLRGASSVQRLGLASQQAAAFGGFAAPVSLMDASRASRACRKLLAAPQLTGIDARAPEWIARGSEIRTVILAGQRLRELHKTWDPLLQHDAWDKDVAVVRRDLVETGQHWWRFLSGRWRSARRQLSTCVSNPLPKGIADLLQITDVLLEAARIKSSLPSMMPILSRLFGASWDGEDSDWDLLLAQFDWITSAVEAVRKNEIAAWCLDPVQRDLDRTELGEHTSTLELAVEYEERVRSEIAKVLDLDSSPTQPIERRPLTDIQQRWSTMAARIETLDSLVAYNQAVHDCRTESLDSIVSVANLWEHAAASVVDLFDRVYMSNMLELAFQERPVLASFDGDRQNQIVEAFRQLDLRHLELSRLRLAMEHAQRLPSANTAAGQIGVLRHEFEKRGRFLPLRKLMSKAGNAVQAIKPVFMMSPLSIANFVPPGALEFGLIIFDEASQVRPADALGAIVRGKQVVVVGDSKQLPPTNFFDTLVSQEPDADEEEAATSDIESILGFFCARGAHQRMLRWHYRSRHESLIAVSNHLFYDNRLIIFPSPDRERNQLGLIYHRVENAPYDRSRTRTNPGEAKAVAEAVIAHACEQLRKPKREQLTLGVAAFSVAQRDAILACVEILRRQNPSCEDFFGSHLYEPFFVKNLENVQGDERDVMIISIGYGRTSDGYLAMSFGPLNRAGGERRLNVLFTRARLRCEVFTTLSADDIDLSRTNVAGVSALKTFLTYAATGKTDIPVQTQRSQDSVFEEQVLDALVRRGYTVHAQVGCAGFFLDLAVVDTEQPSRYILGIECDGAAYHNARSARDRDRLRQAVLEGLNWQIHRIWSTEWFRNPSVELNKVVTAIESARNRIRQAPQPGLQRPPDASLEETASDGTRARSPVVPIASNRKVSMLAKYRTADLHIDLGSTELHLVDVGQLSEWLAKVVGIESPVFWLEAARRVTNAAGVERLGSRIQDAFRRACDFGARSGQFSLRNEFLWRTDMTSPVLRDRSDLPQSAKKIEYVAHEEICVAIEQVAQDTYGVAPGDVAAGACRLLGFARATDEIRTVIEARRDALIAAGRLVLIGQSLVFGKGLAPATN